MRQVLKNSLIANGVLWLLQISAAHADTISINPNIPGVDSPTDLVSIVVNFYQFALLTGAVLAFGSIVYGAVNYALSESAGTKNDAKDRIVDAFIGLALLAGAYLLLYTINPALTILTNPGLEKISEVTNATLPPGGIAVGGGPAAGKCVAPTTGGCSTDTLQKNGGDCFGSNIEKAAGICNIESGNGAYTESEVDKCDDGSPISFGLFQINIAQNTVAGLNCPTAFKNYRVENGRTRCDIVNRDLYNQCAAAAKNPRNNIQKACELSNNGSKWSLWGGRTRRSCGV